MVLYFEKQLSSTWLAEQPFYRFGIEILLGFLAVYIVGLLVSSFLGRWLWAQVDMPSMSVPLLGPLYQAFKTAPRLRRRPRRHVQTRRHGPQP